jgi:polysaccharide export outer membrane protein
MGCERRFLVNSTGFLQSVLVLSALMTIATAQDAASLPAGAPASSESPAAVYVLQPNDEITLHSLKVKEIADKMFRLDEEGQANLPMLGRVHLATLTVAQAEELLRSKLKTYYVEPDLELNVSTVHIEPVSVIGAVGTPGVKEMKGRTTVLDALSLAGGVRPDSGPVVVLTRQASNGAIPLQGAHTTFSGEGVAEINLKSLLDGLNPSDNIVVMPHDVISVPPAQIVYVVGNVKHAGGFPLGGRSNLTVLQALSLAEGLDPRASPEKTRIIRRKTEPEQQIAVDLRKILQGKAEDVVLQPNDILFVPSSATKVITSRTIDAAIQIGTGLAIFATHF